MIEIMEIKDNKEKRLSGVPGSNTRTFAFFEREVSLGTIQFSVNHLKIPLLVKLELNLSGGLTGDLIVDGLIRTACHTFQNDNIHWIVAEEKMVQDHCFLKSFFSPLSAVKETITDEITAEILRIHTKCHVMKTDTIYNGCCKGV